MATLEEKVDKVVTAVNEIRTVLKGYNGSRGLVKEVENQGKQINKLWIVIAIIVASAGGGGAALVKFVLGA